MLTIKAHGIQRSGEDQAGLSAAQQRLLIEPKPIRICGAPTGAGKTYAFLHAARQGIVIFVVPTQALAKDIEDSARRQDVMVFRWDGTQSSTLRADGLEPWIERKNQWDQLQLAGGLLVITPETLAAVILGDPQKTRSPLKPSDLLQARHIVFDEAHTLTARGLGFLHFWAVLVVWWHRKDPDKAQKLTLLSATHSNLFEALCTPEKGEESYIPIDAVAFFDEAVESGTGDSFRMLHGDVDVEVTDCEVLSCVKQYAEEPLKQNKKLLILYDSLRRLTQDEGDLSDCLIRFGIKSEECFLINGQDRKGGGWSLGGTGFEAGLCPTEKHRVIIATSCIEAGVNIQGLEYAILDVGQDAAALLQRIGRIARGAAKGKVWLATPTNRPAHWLKIEKLTGEISVMELYRTLAPLRLLPIERSRQLGSAYWSMLKRRQPALYAGLLLGHETISEAKAPGGLLNSLHAALSTASKRGQKTGKKWLDDIDQELTDLRGFAPTVSIKFADYPVIQYSREWAQAYLERPDYFEDEVWCYRKPRTKCLLNTRRSVVTNLLCPDGNYFSFELQKQKPRDYAGHIRRRAKGLPDEAFLSKAADLIELTGLLVRTEMADDSVI